MIAGLSSDALPLPVIPVLDLQGGIAVRAVGGRREAYQPLKSPLVDGCEPLAVARALAAIVGHRQLYLADLDAIEGRKPNWQVYRKLLAADLDVWLDAGLSSVHCAVAIGELKECGNSMHRVIAALESLPDLETLEAMVAANGPERLVFSLDLREGRPLTSVPSLQRPPIALVKDAASLGIQRIIVLDLAAVGRNEGPCVVDLCREIRRTRSHLELVAGGGIRGAHDLDHFRAAGVDAALVSNWLHSSMPGAPTPSASP